MNVYGDYNAALLVRLRSSGISPISLHRGRGFQATAVGCSKRVARADSTVQLPASNC